MLTFFCKRDRHPECPGEWPVGERCGPDHDCSFDLRMMKCVCDCHLEKANLAAAPQLTGKRTIASTGQSK